MPATVLLPVLIGFVGGLVSGFIGSGGAFVLTPGMMSLGVPGLMAVASNMCHKFPKALVGAIKRAKYGQVDVKLGLVLGVSAEAGVLYGASIQENIKKAYGDAGSNLYVSTAFVLVLAVVGGFVLRDAIKSYRAGHAERRGKAHEDRPLGAVGQHPRHDGLFQGPQRPRLGALHHAARIRHRHARRDDRGRRLHRRARDDVRARRPRLMASATELVIAFVMGLGGSFKYALHGMVDIRLAMIILAGSLFGIQLGAIGTTYVRPYMIKLVMGVIMVIVLFSRALMLPVYLAQLGYMALEAGTVDILKKVGFVVMVAALAAGALIIIGAMIRGHRQHATA